MSLLLGLEHGKWWMTLRRFFLALTNIFQRLSLPLFVIYFVGWQQERAREKPCSFFSFYQRTRAESFQLLGLWRLADYVAPLWWTFEVFFYLLAIIPSRTTWAQSVGDVSTGTSGKERRGLRVWLSVNFIYEAVCGVWSFWVDSCKQKGVFANKLSGIVNKLVFVFRIQQWIFLSISTNNGNCSILIRNPFTNIK